MSNSVAQEPTQVPSQNQQPTPTAAPKRRRWPRVLLVLFVLLALGTWFAPAIIAKTSLRNRIARNAAHDLNGTLDIGDASLGWFSPIELRDVTLTDPQGHVVARVPKITTSRTLFSLLRDHSQPGTISLDKPSIEIICSKNTTNLETVLQRLLADAGVPPGPTRTPITVTITGGTLTLRDADTGRADDFRDVDAIIGIPAGRAEPITATVTANAPQPLEAEVAVGESGRVKLTAKGFALEALAPFLRRIEPGLSVAGSLNASVTASWGKDSASIDGTLGIKNLAVTAPELKGDTLRLASSELPLKASFSQGTLRVDRAELTSDVGTVSVSGTFPSDSPEKLFEHAGVKLDANVDVAKLASLLPKTLSIKDGTEFRAGKLIVKVESTAGESGTIWKGNLGTSALQATRGGKDIHWAEPLSIEFASSVKAGQFPAFDTLICRSDFIAINAKTTPDSVHLGANVFLDRLAMRLADFVDLGGITLDGRGSVKLIVDRSRSGNYMLEASVDLKQFAIIDRGGKGLREPTLNLQLIATGKAPRDGTYSISSARFTGVAGVDELHLSLLEPIRDTKQLDSGKFDAKLTGGLGRWRIRIAALLPVLDDYHMAGIAKAQGIVRFAQDAIHVDQLSLNIDNAKFVGAGLDIDEPNMNAVADLKVDRKARITTFANFTINSAPLSVSRGTLVIETPKDGQMIVHGGGPAVTKLNRLGKMVGIYVDPRGPTAIYGKGTGPIHFRYMGDVTTFNGSLDIAGFGYGPLNDLVFSEPTMRLELDGSYTESTDIVAFKAAKIERPGLALNGAGSIGKFASITDTNLAGNVTYDMALLTPKLRELLGGDFTATGKGTKPFSFVGSLTPPPRPGSQEPPSVFANATGEFAIGWDSARTHGFAMGPAELRAKLADGVARITPITATFGGGKVSVQPTVRLSPAPQEIKLAKGLLVEKAKLTPAVCASALGYALPAIANAAQAEGEISVQLGENHIPLADTRQATIKGTVTIHKATVTAGPVVTEIAKLLGADSGTMTLANEQAVPVRVERGRVYHENLNIKVGGYIVKTSGSVGFDNTVDLVADVPIPGGLPGFKNAPALAKALTGKRVLVPIKGTLSQPTLDPKAFSGAIAKLAQDSAKDIGKDVLHKELDKLFQGMSLPGGNPGLFGFPLPKK